MAIIKCKMCGGELKLVEGSTTAKCEYCETVQTIPVLDDEKKLVQFERAERLRKQCDFDKAAGIYENIVADYRQEAEAYWGLVLCKYGIEYVDDPGTGKKIPTCHRSSFDSILDDPDLEQAMENADSDARKLYREEAKAIEEIRKGIISVSSTEKPYDIFICYKETDPKGDRTLDSVLAQDIYDKLTEKGYRVFFSRITLEDKLGMEYEPYIFAALNSAKVMLVFGTDYEYFNAVWVKNEWSRFLKLMAKDKEKHLIPCFKGIDAYDMPKEFAKLQSQDLGKVGADQDLLRGIEKLLPRNTAPAAPEQVVVGGSGDNKIASLLDRGNMALEDGDWAKADSFFEDVLNNDSKNAQAYLGKALAQEKCRTIDAFIRKRKEATQNAFSAQYTMEPNQSHIHAQAEKYTVRKYLDAEDIVLLYRFDLSYSSTVADRKKQLQDEENYWKNHKSLSRAEQFATGAVAENLANEKKALFDVLRQRIQKAEAEEAAAKQAVQDRYTTFIAKTDADVVGRHEKACTTRESNYRDWCKTANESSDIRKLTIARDGFQKLQDYQDSKAMLTKCKQRITEEETKRALQERQKEEAKKAAEARQKAKEARRAVIKVLVIIGIIAAVIIFLICLFTSIIPGNKYEKADALYQSGSYMEAADAFLDLEDYKDSQDRAYSCAEVLYESGNYAQAVLVFEKMDHPQARQRIYEIWKELSTPAILPTCAIGSTDAISIKNDGTVQITEGWLNSAFGTTNINETPIGAINNAIGVAFLGKEDAVVLKADGTVSVFCKENSEYCNTKKTAEKWTGIVDIAANGGNLFGLQSGGTLVCTNANANHEISSCQNAVNIVSGSIGTDFVAAILADGTVWSSGAVESVAQEVSQWTDIVDLDIGSYQIVGLKSNGTVMVSCSVSSYGQKAAQDWNNIVDIACGRDFVIGITASGKMLHTANDTTLENIVYAECGYSSECNFIAVDANGKTTSGGQFEVGDGNSAVEWTAVRVPDRQKISATSSDAEITNPTE